MKANVGNIDRIIRILVGLGIGSFFFLLEGKLKFLGLIGIIPLLTAFIKFCPLYTLFGINTCSTK